MVTGYTSPVVRIAGDLHLRTAASAVVLLIITTAAAPAFWPKTARATRAQVPRCTTAILPATPAATYSFGSQPTMKVLVPALEHDHLQIRRRDPVGIVRVDGRDVLRSVGPWSRRAARRSRSGRSRFLVAPAATAMPLVARARRTEDVGECCRHCRPPRPRPTLAFGSVVRREGVRAVGRIRSQNPSDMLITSMSLSMAHSMASTHDIGRARATEHADRVQVGLRRNAGSDRERVVGMREVARTYPVYVVPFALHAESGRGCRRRGCRGRCNRADSDPALATEGWESLAL